jgi:hypothetical protein
MRNHDRFGASLCLFKRRDNPRFGTSVIPLTAN